MKYFQNDSLKDSHNNHQTFWFLFFLGGGGGGGGGWYCEDEWVKWVKCSH